MSEQKSIAVKVAVRARPLVKKEILEGCENNLTFVSNVPQVIVSESKAFTFDYAFPCDCSQEELYNDAVANRIDYLFKGYNVTVLAYGQTGSGKTHTMGTSYSLTSGGDDSNWGVIQRAVQDIFKGIEKRMADTEFLVKVSFLEVYKEDVFDLLQKSKDNSITIREDQDGIKIVGLTEQPVTSALETFQALEQGAISRTTAATAMNAGSSRSHAIFTITLEQRSVCDNSDLKRAKFHLVDLAGSERANKTGTSGERFKEGVNINRGLLALGNVISSLCDDSPHVPYRDSKLTRLLQDSLGGNSYTIMIACVSPADSNLDETLNTLRYADRARKIKNKPIVNRDPQTAELQKLKQQVQQLQLLLLQNGKNPSPTSRGKPDDDMKIILERNKQLERENQRLAKELQSSLDQTTAFCEKAIQVETNNGKLIHQLEELKSKTNKTVEALMGISEDNPELQDQLQLLKGLQNKIVDIQCDQAHKSLEFSIYSPCQKNRTAARIGNISSSDDSDVDTSSDDLTDSGEKAQKSTLKQAAMSRELLELERMLAVKEELACKMQESDSQMAVMRIQYESNVKQMEEEINNLQKEKEDLTSTLKAVQASSKASKVSEQRRKRLQELEQKISDMKKQIQEKSRLLKMKQDAERKVDKLQNEIQAMKTARVRLLKQIREESERFRSLKIKSEREVAQLKQKDRKRQYEMVKLQDEVKKQKNVLKRKMEEAAAANKRLNEALKLQKSVSERRLKENHSSVQGIGSRVQQWLMQEIELVLSGKEAQHYLKILMEDRKVIVEQINLLKAVHENAEPPAKKGSRESTDEESRETDEQIESLEKELKLRNLRIAELQQEISNADQDEKAKHRWETVQNMVEAKCALKYLFESVITAKFQNFMQASETENANDTATAEKAKLQSKNELMNDTIQSLNKDIRYMRENHEKQMSTVIQKNEDKVIYLMKQLTEMNSSSSLPDSSALADQFKFQQKELERMGYMNDELELKNKEIEELKNELSQAQRGNRKPPKFCNAIKKSTDSVFNDGKRNRSNMGSYLAFEDLNDSNDENFLIDTDNVLNDPDYRNTPQARQSRKQVSRVNNRTSDKDETYSEKNNCNCRGGCGSKRCKCRKVGGFCTEFCKCSATICINRNKEQTDTTETNNMNATFSKENPSISHSVLSEVSGNASHNDSDDFVYTKPFPRTLYVDSINNSGIKAVGSDRSEKFRKAFRDQNFLLN